MINFLDGYHGLTSSIAGQEYKETDTDWESLKAMLYNVQAYEKLVKPIKK